MFVDEPSVEDTIAILRGLKERYEVHHGIRIKDSALVAAAMLSHRYIADRKLPDKAIDLIDEAASRLRMEIDSLPVELDELHAPRTAARDREAGAGARDRHRQQDAAAAARGGARAAAPREWRELETHWKKEKEVVSKIRELKAERERIKIEEAKAERLGDLARVAELRYGQLLADRAPDRAGERAAREDPARAARC